MSRTQRKLAEARFFAGLVAGHRSAHPQFDYYLSAFVSAARSVTWVMRAEYHAIQGWEQWFSDRHNSPTENVLLRKINDLRVRSEKTHPIEADAIITMHIPPERFTTELKQHLMSSKGKRCMLTVYGASESGEVVLPDGFPGDAILGSFQGVERHVDEFPGEDVVNVCTQYLCFLEQVVAECEANHAL